jgi:hypothetical protein
MQNIPDGGTQALSTLDVVHPSIFAQDIGVMFRDAFDESLPRDSPCTMIGNAREWVEGYEHFVGHVGDEAVQRLSGRRVNELEHHRELRIGGTRHVCGE